MSNKTTVVHKLGFHEYIWMIVLTCVVVILYTIRTETIERGLPMTKNYDVVSCFLGHAPSQGAISTDGEELRSYGIVIARWNKDEILLPDSSVFHSITTTKHRNLVRAMALSQGITVKEVN